ncbi:MAG: bacterial regulatory s, luxR family protein [Rhizobium sp.]|nr:bacterial regulatory s, luxR family protein [Rhizobium sp.]
MALKYTVTNAIIDIYNCKGAQSAIDCFRGFIVQHHIDTFTSGEIDLANRKRNVFHAMEWPERWRNYYFQSGMLEHDPVVGALGQTEGAFTWAELRIRRGLSIAGTEALTKIAAEGWTDGLVVPLHRRGTHYGLVSLVANDHMLDKHEKADLTAVSLVFHDRIRHLVPRDGFRISPAGLTPREIECVKMIALGLSDRKAGEALGISGSTVHEHAERAKRKLDARNRAELVAIATRFAIIPT